MEARWLGWARRMMSIAQNGLGHPGDPYDKERFTQLQKLAAEILGAHTDADAGSAKERLAMERGYLTPKVDVRGAVVDGSGRVLLVRERADGAWTLPGGWADPGDTPREAVERELREEAGLAARAVKLIGVYDRRLHGHPPTVFDAYKLVFLCAPEAGATPRAVIEGDLEITGIDWFSVDALPQLSITRTTPWMIDRVVEHQRDPTLSTDFD